MGYQVNPYTHRQVGGTGLAVYVDNVNLYTNKPFVVLLYNCCMICRNFFLPHRSPPPLPLPYLILSPPFVPSSPLPPATAASTTMTPTTNTPHAGTTLSLDHSLDNHETFFGSATKRTPTGGGGGGEDRDHGYIDGYTNGQGLGQGLGRSQGRGERDGPAKAELMQSIAQHSMPGPQLVLWLDEEIR